jgi:RNA polymerase sigma-70 factor (ECF subfamily)
VRRIRAGEPGYPAVLCDRYADRVYRQCRRILHDPDRARDLTQDVLERVLTQLHQLHDGAALAAWIKTITYRRCLNYLKAAGLHRTEALDQVPDLPYDDDDALARKIRLELQLDRLEHFLTLLREDERLILLMRYREGHSIHEIAAILHLGDSAVKMRLKRGRDHLAGFFARERGE